MKPSIVLFLGLLIVSWPLTGNVAPETAQVQIGVLAYRPLPKVRQKWQALESLLNQRIDNYRFRIRLLDNDRLADEVASRNLDFVFTTSSQYVYLQHRFGLSAPLLTIVNSYRGMPLRAYGGVIFTRQDRGDIQQLADTVGKRVASIGTVGFAGYLLQAHQMHRANLPLPSAQDLLITGQPQDLVVQAVLAGAADVGYVRTGVLENLVDNGDMSMSEVRILNRQTLDGFPFASSTPLYPDWPMAALPHVDARLLSQVTGILLLLRAEDGAEVLPGIHGFDVPANYLGTEKLLHELRAPPFDFTPKVAPLDIWHNYKPEVFALVSVVGLTLIGLLSFIALALALRRARDDANGQRQRLADIITATHVGTWEWDIQSGRLKVNPRWAEILGYALDELAPLCIQSVKDFLHPQDSEKWQAGVEAIMNGQSAHFAVQARMRHKQGHWVWIEDNGRVIKRNRHMMPVNLSGMRSDISDQKEREATLRELAHTDALTGLANRMSLLERLRLTMSIQQRRGGELVLAYIDLNGFKAVNDNYGHAAGDALLKTLAKRFAASMRGEDTIARIGGDEFVALFTSVASRGQALTLVKRLIERANEPVDFNGQSIKVSAAVGLTCYPQKGRVISLSDLMQQGDAAMYQAKGDTERNIVWYAGTAPGEGEARAQESV